MRWLSAVFNRPMDAMMLLSSAFVVTAGHKLNSHFIIFLGGVNMAQWLQLMQAKHRAIKAEKKLEATWNKIEEEARENDGPSVTCPKCGLVSYHPREVVNKYCGSCKAFHKDLAG